MRLHAEPGQAADLAKLKARIRTELDNVARTKALQGYEIPRDFIVETMPFSKENNLITDSSKPARGAMKKKCAAFYALASLADRPLEHLSYSMSLSCPSHLLRHSAACLCCSADVQSS